jgi:hypothetical protein
MQFSSEDIRLLYHELPTQEQVTFVAVEKIFHKLGRVLEIVDVRPPEGEDYPSEVLIRVY